MDGWTIVWMNGFEGQVEFRSWKKTILSVKSSLNYRDKSFNISELILCALWEHKVKDSSPAVCFFGEHFSSSLSSSISSTFRALLPVPSYWNAKCPSTALLLHLWYLSCDPHHILPPLSNLIKSITSTSYPLFIEGRFHASSSTWTLNMCIDWDRPLIIGNSYLFPNS